MNELIGPFSLKATALFIFCYHCSVLCLLSLQGAEDIPTEICCFLKLLQSRRSNNSYSFGHLIRVYFCIGQPRY
ncbi:mCG147439 [Mus musculus]|nr:mCG147439 [Mus musculus]